jgi:uncharacterized protein (TIGR00369 family)
MMGHDIPFLDFVGARLVEWSPGLARVALTIEPRHLNRSGVVHGGLYAVLVDAAGGLAGLYSPDPVHPRKAFTLSLTTSFLDAAGGGTLMATGRERRGGRRVYFATVEVASEDGRLVAVGEGSFLYRAPGVSSRAAGPGEHTAS